MNLTPRKRFAAATAVLVLTVTGVAACGGDDDDSSSSTTASKTLCDDSQALKSSIDDLKNVDIVQNGTSSAERGADEGDRQRDHADRLGQVRLQARGGRSPVVVAEARVVDQGHPAKGLDPVKEAATDVETSAQNLTDAIDKEKCS